MRIQDHRRILAVFPSLTALSLILYLHSSNWNLLDRWNYRGEFEFGDLRVLIDSLICKISVMPSSEEGLTCPKTVYGTFTDILFQFPATYNWNLNLMVVGLLCCFFVSITFLSYSANSNSYSLILSILLISPPLILLFERANLDLLIFSFLIISTLTFFSRVKIISIVLLVITVLLKFYTFPVIILFLLTERDRKWKKILISILVILSAILSQDLFFSSRNNDFSAGSAFGAFGVTSFDKLLLQSRGLNTHSMCTILIVIAYLAFIFRELGLSFIKKLIKRFESVDNASALVFYSFSLIFLEFFFLNLNYDYRLLFLIPVVCSSFYRNRFSNIFTFFAFYFSYNLNGIQILGDLAILGIVFFVTSLLIKSQNVSSNNQGSGSSCNP